MEAPVRRTSETLARAASLVVPVVLKLVPFLKATELVTSRLAPRDVRPPLTVKVLVPATVVLPFRVLIPEPVVKLPAPDCRKLE